LAVVTLDLILIWLVVGHEHGASHRTWSPGSFTAAARFQQHAAEKTLLQGIPAKRQAGFAAEKSDHYSSRLDAGYPAFSVLFMPNQVSNHAQPAET